jgi:hypothetical protein
MENQSKSEEQIISAETSIGYLLRGGVFFAGILIGIGSLLSFFRAPQFQGASSDIFALLGQGRELPNGVVAPFQWSVIREGLILGSSNAWITLGLIVLIGLPTLRVALAGVVFLIQKDYLFVVFCALVLFNLAFGFLSRSML